MVERGVVIKQKHGRNVVYRAAGQQPQAPCAPEFALLKPRPMTTIPVREGGVIMPFYGLKPALWLTGNCKHESRQEDLQKILRRMAAVPGDPCRFKHWNEPEQQPERQRCLRRRNQRTENLRRSWCVAVMGVCGNRARRPT